MRIFSKHWPADGLNKDDQIACKLSFVDSGILSNPLWLSGWEVTSNSSFTKALLYVKSCPELQARWVSVLSQLGQPHDVIFESADFSLVLPHPVCTHSEWTHIYLHYVTPPLD
jgi:hypothetical protein